MVRFTEIDQWARPTEFDQQATLWGNNTELNDALRQGLLGDNWLLGSAMALAEWPTRLKKIFTQQEYPSDGLFELSLFLGGRLQDIVIDDRFPLHGTGVPAAAQRTVNGGWWAPVLEKAVAKMHQNYVRLSGGMSNEAMRLLTGMPVILHLPKYFH